MTDAVEKVCSSELRKLNLNHKQILAIGCLINPLAAFTYGLKFNLPQFVRAESFFDSIDP